MAGELILIVEDNEKSRKLLRDVLQASGYETIESETAEGGIELARKSMPALILMDIQLPGIDGVEARIRLRSDPTTEDIPVFAVTASAMLHDRGRIDRASFDGYYSKPLKVKEFLTNMREFLDTRG